MGANSQKKGPYSVLVPVQLVVLQPSAVTVTGNPITPSTETRSTIAPIAPWWVVLLVTRPTQRFSGVRVKVGVAVAAGVGGGGLGRVGVAVAVGVGVPVGVAVAVGVGGGGLGRVGVVVAVGVGDGGLGRVGVAVAVGVGVPVGVVVAVGVGSVGLGRTVGVAVAVGVGVDTGRWANLTTATPGPRIETRTRTPSPWGITVRVPTGMGANSQKKGPYSVLVPVQLVVLQPSAVTVTGSPITPSTETRSTPIPLAAGSVVLLSTQPIQAVSGVGQGVAVGVGSTVGPPVGVGVAVGLAVGVGVGPAGRSANRTTATPGPHSGT
jgi:hypothetical protein